MLKISESNVFKELEAMIGSQGSLNNAISTLHKKTLSDPRIIITRNNQIWRIIATN